jgi:hypothetical protein
MTRFAPLVIALVLAGCGVPRTEPGAGGAFPHPEGFEDAHGTAEAGGISGCTDCHGMSEGDAVAGVTPVAPACRSCHAVYPHPASMELGAAHGAAWLAEGATCDRCHGADGARSPGSSDRGRCVGCHSTFPHAAGWEEGVAHGAAARERGASACFGCHGVGGDAARGQACGDCHDGFPHPDGFADPALHGAVWRATPDGCPACHAVDAAAPERVACASCHDLFPHADDWSGAHPAATQQRGERSCRGCHEGGVAGPVLPTSCAPACHEGSVP